MRMYNLVHSGPRKQGSECVLIGMFALLTSIVAGAGELRPYELPSQRAPVYSSPAPAQPPPSAQPTPRDHTDVVGRFRQRISGLSPSERESLKADFTAKLNNATAQNQWKEAEYYATLLQVLDEPR